MSVERKKIAIIGSVGIPANYGGFETLAEKLSENSGTGAGFSQEFKIGEFDCSINIVKV